MTEAQLQRKVTDYARKRGVFARKLVAVNYNGFPDVFMAYQGEAWFLELKTPKKTGRLSALQEITIEDMRDQGLHVYVSSDYDHAITIINKHINHATKNRLNAGTKCGG